MIPDVSTTAAERTEEARELFDRVADGEVVDLTALSALELCVLGGPKHTLGEAAVAQAWSELGDRRRNKAVELTTQGLIGRGLLADNSSEAHSAGADGAYDIAPNLAVVLAARCRPTFVVVTEIAERRTRTPRFYALGDQEELVGGIVVEDPAAVPEEAGELPYLEKLGPLGWLYQYMLVSRSGAADLLARWAISPLPVPVGPDVWCPHVTSLYRRNVKSSAMGLRIISDGDGETARLFEPADGGGVRVVAQLGPAGLREEMTKLLDQGVL